MLNKIYKPAATLVRLDKTEVSDPKMEKQISETSEDFSLSPRYPKIALSFENLPKKFVESHPFRDMENGHILASKQTSKLKWMTRPLVVVFAINMIILTSSQTMIEATLGIYLKDMFGVRIADMGYWFAVPLALSVASSITQGILADKGRQESGIVLNGSFLSLLSTRVYNVRRVR